MQAKVMAGLLAAAGLLGGQSVLAAETGKGEPGNMLVRARAVYLDFDNKQRDGLDTNAGGTVEADSRWIPEVDLTYFVTKNIAAELSLTWPQKVDITVGGANQGNVKVLPPSLVLQYHFDRFGAFKPYVGLGVNYTRFTDRTNILGGAGELDKSSWGAVGQIGLDYAIDKRWSVNVDAKYIQMESDVKLNGSKIGRLEMNPVTLAVGVGYRF